MGCIYLARHRTTGKGYVGKTTKTLKARRYAHEHNASRGVCPYFHAALVKYGFHNFDWTVIFETDWEEELNVAEAHFIAALGTKVPNGYNLTDGGEGRAGCSPSEETRAKMRKSQQTRPPRSSETRAKMSASRMGYKPSKETREKMSAVRRGRKLSPETRKKMSGKTPWNKGKKVPLETRERISAVLQGRTVWNKGKKASPETRAKMAAAKRGRKFSSETRAKMSTSRRNWISRNKGINTSESPECAMQPLLPVVENRSPPLLFATLGNQLT